MIVKFFSRGSGGGAGPVDYLLDKDRARDQAYSLRGDPEESIEVIDACPYARKYTAGVLSFQEADLSAVQKDKIMTRFEQALLPGLDPDQYNILWVQHQDKGRLELNFVVANTELTSGKRLQPYYDRADRGRIDAWKSWINASLDLHDPDDPANRQAYGFPDDLPKNKQEAADKITETLTGMIRQGLIEDRAGIVDVLEKHGITIARQTRSSISIADPDGGRNIRLKGVIYEQTFRFDKFLSGERDAASREFDRDRPDRARRSRELYQEYAETKREKNRKRYPRPKPAVAPAVTQQLAAGGPDLPAHRPGRGRGVEVPEQDDRGSLENNQQSEPDHRTPGRDDLGDHPAGERSGPVHHPTGGPDDRHDLEHRKTKSDSTDRPGVTDDRTRETLTGNLRKIGERIAEEAHRVCELFQRIASDVRRYREEKRRAHEAGQRLKLASRGLNQAIAAVVEVMRAQRQQDHGIER